MRFYSDYSDYCYCCYKKVLYFSVLKVLFCYKALRSIPSSSIFPHFYVFFESCFSEKGYFNNSYFYKEEELKRKLVFEMMPLLHQVNLRLPSRSCYQICILSSILLQFNICNICLKNLHKVIIIRLEDVSKA